jgi:hypothetical protein
LRKLWIRRKGVSTMIGGIIVLSLFLIALVAMVVVSQQYDNYQSTVNAMSQKDIDKASENLQGVLPGVDTIGQTSTGTCTSTQGGPCNIYTVYFANLGISTTIARVYIVTNIAASPLPQGIYACSPCILDPAPVSGTPPQSQPAPSSFDQASTGTINLGEAYHGLTLWLPLRFQVKWDNQESQSQTITVVTTRGRVFSFLYPFPKPTQGTQSEAQGGTGLQIGPLVITYQKTLITYTTSSVYGSPAGSSNPGLPIGGTNGFWTIPTGTVVVWVKIQTDWWATSDVYLTAQSVLNIVSLATPGAVDDLWIVAPSTTNLCTQYFQNPSAGGDSTVDCSSSYTGGNAGDPANLTPYAACSITPPQYYANPTPGGATDYNSYPGVGQPPLCAHYRYRIARPTPEDAANQKRGPPVYVGFAAKGPSDNGSKNIISGHAGAATSFLGLEYVYDPTYPSGESGTKAYIYGVTLPFIDLCLGGAASCAT